MVNYSNKRIKGRECTESNSVAIRLSLVHSFIVLHLRKHSIDPRRAKMAAVNGKMHGSVHGKMHDKMHGSVHGKMFVAVHNKMHASVHGSVHGRMHGSVHGKMTELAWQVDEC